MGRRRHSSRRRETPLCETFYNCNKITHGKPKRVLLDTCVLINAMEADYAGENATLPFCKAHGHHTLADVLQNQKLCATRETLKELKDVLICSNKVNSLIPDVERRRFYLFIEKSAQLVNPAPEGSYPHCPTDPGDNIIAAAACSKGPHIDELVSQNYDLLLMDSLKDYGIQVLNGATYVSRMFSNADPSHINTPRIERFHTSAKYPTPEEAMNLSMEASATGAFSKKTQLPLRPAPKSSTTHKDERWNATGSKASYA